MFHTASLEGYTSSINKAVDVLSDNLQSAAERGEVVDMWRQLGKMTMQVGQPCCWVLGSWREPHNDKRALKLCTARHPAGLAPCWHVQGQPERADCSRSQQFMSSAVR